MRVLLDTGRLSEILRHDEHAVRVFEKAEEVFIPFVALAELKAGKPIPTNDLWIASLAIQHQLPVLTRDGHFSKIAQVALC